MNEVRLTPEAVRDLGGIRRYTENQWGADQARSYLDGLGLMFKRLAAGRAVDQSAEYVRPGYRRATYRHHFIYFVRTNAGIEVVRVMHDRQDAERHLRG